MNLTIIRKVICRTIEVRQMGGNLYVYYRGESVGRLPYGLKAHFGVISPGRYRIVFRRNKTGRYVFDKTSNWCYSIQIDVYGEVLRVCNTKFQHMFGAVRGGVQHDITVTKVKVKNDK